MNARLSRPTRAACTVLAVATVAVATAAGAGAVAAPGTGPSAATAVVRTDAGGVAAAHGAACGGTSTGEGGGRASTGGQGRHARGTTLSV